MPTILPDQLIEKWRVKRLLAQGGQGAVYEAVNEGIDQRGALKVLLSLHGTPEQILRFNLEARAVNAIRHPNIPQVHDYGLFPDGVPWMVMEYLDGESLESRLNRERLSLVETLAIAEDVASAIAAAHQKGIIHRDLKWSNVMLVPDDTKLLGTRAMVLDFGIAKLIEADGPTGTGTLIGTPIFMAWEQIERPKEVDGKADVYSLGVMLFQMLCQRLPFPYEKGDSTLLILARKADPPTLIEDYAPELPDELRTLVNAMLQKDRTQRPTMAAVRLTLRQIQGLPPPRQTGGFGELKGAPASLPPRTLDLHNGKSDEHPTVDAPLDPIDPVAPALAPAEQKIKGEGSPRSPILAPKSLSEISTNNSPSPPQLRAGPHDRTIPALAMRRVVPWAAGMLLFSAGLTTWIALSHNRPTSAQNVGVSPPGLTPPISPTPAPNVAQAGRVAHDKAEPSSPTPPVVANGATAPDVTPTAEQDHAPTTAAHPHGRSKDRSACATPKPACVTGKDIDTQLGQNIADAFAEAKVQLCASERVLLELDSRDLVVVDAPGRLDKDDRALLRAALRPVLRSRMQTTSKRITVEVRCKR